MANSFYIFFYINKILLPGNLHYAFFFLRDSQLSVGADQGQANPYKDGIVI